MRFNVLVALVVATFVSSCSSFVTAETTALDGYTYDGKEVVRRLREDSEVQEERGPREKWREVVALLPRSPIAEVDTQSIANNALLHQQSGDVTNVNLIEHEVLQNPNPLPKSATDLEPEVPQNLNSPHKLATNLEHAEGPSMKETSHLETPRIMEDMMHPKTSRFPSMDWDGFVNSLSAEELELMQKQKIDVKELRKSNSQQIFKVMELAVKGTEKERSFWTTVLVYTLYSIGLASFIAVAYNLMIGGLKPRPTPDLPAGTSAGA